MFAIYPLCANTETRVTPNWFTAERMDYVTKSTKPHKHLFGFIQNLFH